MRHSSGPGQSGGQNYDKLQMRRAAAAICENVGFATANQSSVDTLGYLMRTYMESLCKESISLANNSDRLDVCLDDVFRVFDTNDISLNELHDYIRQVGPFPVDINAPLFPVERQITPKAEEIPLEEDQENGGTTEVTNEIDMDNTSNNNGSNAQVTKGDTLLRPETPLATIVQNDPKKSKSSQSSQRQFPDFFASRAVDLGFIVERALPPPPKLTLLEEPVVIKAELLATKSTTIAEPPTRKVSKESAPKDILEVGKKATEEVKLPEKEKQIVEEIEPTQVIPQPYIRQEQAVTSVKINRLESLVGSLLINKQIAGSNDEEKQTGPVEGPSSSSQKEVHLEEPKIPEIPEKEKQTVQKIVINLPERKEGHTKKKKKRDKEREKEETSEGERNTERREKKRKKRHHGQQLDSEGNNADADAKRMKMNEVVQPQPIAEQKVPKLKIKFGRPKPPSEPSSDVPVENNVIRTPSPPLTAELIQIPDATVSMKSTQPLAPAAVLPLQAVKETLTTVAPLPAEEPSAGQKSPKKTSKKKQRPSPPEPPKTEEAPTPTTIVEVAPASEPTQKVPKCKIRLEKSKQPEKSISPPAIAIPQLSSPPATSLQKQTGSATVTHPTTVATSSRTATPVQTSRVSTPVSRPSSVAKSAPPPIPKPTVTPRPSSANQPPIKKPAGTITPRPSSAATMAQPSTSPQKSVGGKGKAPGKSSVPKSKAPPSKQKSKATPSSKCQEEIVIESDEDEPIWICPVCSVAYVEGAADMVGCDGCDRWYHWGCVGLQMAPPENKSWFCPECNRKRKKSGNTGTSSAKKKA